MPMIERRRDYNEAITRDMIGLVTAMFGAAGTLLNVSKRAQNQGKVRALVLIRCPYYQLVCLYLLCGFGCTNDRALDTSLTLGRR